MSQAWDLIKLIRQSRALGASDLHIVTGVPPVLRIHGEIVPVKAEALDRDRAATLATQLFSEEQRAKLAAERELCVSYFDAEVGRVRLTAYYQAGVPELAVRLCTAEIPDAATLALPPVVAELGRRSSGLVLVTGRNGVGKTTTLNFMVDLINRERRAKVVMIEDPVEYVHRPIRSVIVQQEVYTDTLSFPRALGHVLRQNPDVIVIGELRELETISTAIAAAETGHLVLATLHTPSALQAVERITSLFPPVQQRLVTLQLANCLQGVVCQDLVPTADRQKRVLACEVLVVTDAVRAMIREDKTHALGNVMVTGRKHGMQTMDNALLDLYQRGVISYDAAASRMRDPSPLARPVAGPETAPA